MAELADALDSGSSGRKPVEVRVLFSALSLFVLKPKRQPTSISMGTLWTFDSSFRPHEHDLTGYDYAAVMPKRFQ